MEFTRRELLLATGASMLAPTAQAMCGPRHHGMSLAHIHRADRGYGSDACRRQLDALAKLGVTHLSITPFGYQPTLGGTTIRFGPTLDRTLTDEALAQVINDAHQRQMVVMLKPHIWSDDFWKGSKSRQDIDPGSREGWIAWFAAYGDFLEHYARLAQETRSGILCVGLEYLKATQQMPGAWAAIAGRCRKVYDGVLTYAGNWWQEAEAMQDWSAFDLIGVQAYFPMSKAKDPTTADLVEGFSQQLAPIEALHRKTGKLVVFTEVGLRPVEGAALEPWSQSHQGALDEELQTRTYEAIFEVQRQKPWIWGLYWWKWFTDEVTPSNGYTPMGRPASQVLARHWR